MLTYKDVLLTSEDYIKSTTNISENIAGNYLLPAIRFAQHQYLEEVIGSALVKKLQKLVFDKEIDDDKNVYYAELLNTYIQDFLSYRVIEELIVNVSVKINNFGASRTEDEKQYNVSYNEVFSLKDFYKHKADYLQYRMQLYVIEHYNEFPELVTYKGIEDLRQNLYSAAGCSVWLGGSRGKALFPDSYGGYLKWKYNFPSSSNKK